MVLALINLQNKEDQIVSNSTEVKGSSIFQIGRFLASFAVDGNFNQGMDFCFHSDVRKNITVAWLRIDLGRVFEVNSVKFWYRNGSTYENKKSRLPGFSIRVSNDTTVPTSSSSCYTSLQSDDMRTVIEKACERTTRYVWIYQNHTAAGDVCPILEICEVQVFGDPIEVTDSRMAIQSTTERLMNASQLLKSIIIEDGKKDVKFIQVTVSGILHMMENTTLPTKEISAGNLNTTLDILDMIVNITGPAIENTEGKHANIILKNMDHVNEILIQKANVTTTRFCGTNIELTIKQTKLDENDISFPEVLSSNTSDNSNEMSTFLELPKQNINASKDMQYVAIIYKTLPELLSLDHHRNEKKKNQTGKSKTKTFVNSAILSLTTQNDIGILDPPLALTFRHIVNNESNELHPVCVSWEFKTRYIKSEQNIMMLNMCGALTISLVMFITTVENTHDGNLCVAITAIIHYLLLVTFFSMLGIGVYYFMSITVTYYAMYMAKNFKSKPRIHWFLIGAWGLPIIITGTNLRVFWENGYHLKNQYGVI
eukprot:XP_019919979.1 PREDICTED: adhesion G-protein coupled receptor G7 [Crassostrea gigas]